MWSFFKKRTVDPGPPPQKIEIFSRHCFYSSISQYKQRFENFSREACWKNFLEMTDFSRANLTVLLDVAKGNEHFVLEQSRFPVLKICEGSEAGSFLQLLDHVERQNYHPETVLYFVEDDYLHRAGWVDILLEGMAIGDYATLYDHKDKYFDPNYETLRSKIFASPSCHWRTVPSTTHTFAVRWKTLQRDLSIHRRFSSNRAISADHKKFSLLTKRGAMLVSPMPGWSTHAEPKFASPCIDWARLFHTVKE